jgi:hypothetical protein
MDTYRAGYIVKIEPGCSDPLENDFLYLSFFGRGIPRTRDASVIRNTVKMIR